MQYSPYSGLGFDPAPGQMPFGMNQPFMQNQQQFQQPMMQQQQPQQFPGRPQIDPRTFETPTITMGENHKPLFSVAKDSSVANPITVDNVSDAEVEKKKRGTTRKKTVESTTAMVKAEDTALTGTVENAATIYSYQETNNLLHDTLGQIDAINSELVQEFNAVRQNRTMKNKYMTLNNLSENIGAMLSNRIATIKEINNCISKANDLDYKKYKDVQAAQSAMNDDKYIADLYQAFMQNPQAQAPTYQMPAIDQSLVGSSIIRANIPDSAMNNGGAIDAGYLSYISNMTPEQNLMRFESNPDVKQVVVYDASTGNKFFQMMNTATGEAIPNLPTYDMSIMEDTTLDLNNKIAKNLNLRENFPIVVINDNIASQY